MNLKQYIAFFAVGTTIGWSAWILVLLSIDPAHAGALGLVMFYVSLAVGLGGLLTTIATIVRVIRYPKADIELTVLRSLRQGILLTLLVIGSLILLSIELLVWWTLLLEVAIVGLIEFLFILQQKRKNP